LEREMAVAGRIFEQDVRARDVGRHQVRRELDTAVLKMERIGERAHEHRLAEARHAFEEDVPAGQQRDHHSTDYGLLADDHPANVALEQAGCLPQIVDVAWRLAHRTSSFRYQRVPPSRHMMELPCTLPSPQPLLFLPRP